MVAGPPKKCLKQFFEEHVIGGFTVLTLQGRLNPTFNTQKKSYSNFFSMSSHWIDVEKHIERALVEIFILS